MQENQQDSPATEHSLRTVNVLDYLVVLAKRKRFITRFVGATIVLTAALLFLVLPRWYRSTAVVMPPKQKNALGLMTALSRATAPLRSLGLGKSPEELSDFQTILASRRVKEAVVNKFDLMHVYDLDTMEKTIRELEDNMSVGTGKEEVSVEVSVLDTDPARAAEMANYFVETLNRVYLEMSVSEAKGNREFLERRYLQNLEDLKKAEESFRGFQEKYGVYSVPDQVKAAVEAAATLESKIVLKEVQLGILQQTATEENPARQEVELELREMRKQLADMKFGKKGEKSASLVFPPFEKAPEIGIEYFRHFREVELQGKLLELLLPLYEQAKIEEQRNTPSVIVLDTAVPAVKHTKPKRLLILGLAAVGALLVGFLAAMVMESLEKASAQRSEADDAKISLVRRELSFRNLFR